MQNSWVGVFFAYPFKKIIKKGDTFLYHPYTTSLNTIYTLLYIGYYTSGNVNHLEERIEYSM